MFDLDYTIPVINPDQYEGSYNGIPVDASDPRYKEPLIRLEEVGVAYQSHHARTDGLNWPYHRPVEGSRPDMWLRKSAAEMLGRANEHLRPFGLELFILDAYRTMECQRGLWDFYYAEGRTKRPHASETVWRNYALQHIADPLCFSPTDPTTWSAHPTGGAVDLTLRSLSTGEVVDMGARFEEITPISYNDHFERQLAKGLIDPNDSRLWHRRLLHWAMSREGFLNDPFVFWHFDWGNQLYVKIRSSLFADAPKAAWYGYVESPPSV
jgi:D-alanyl-D-alanine dipeptidase